jgi:nicotinamide-nucleotide amidase
MADAGLDRMIDARQLHTMEIIAVGSELLGSTRVDTNSLVISEYLGSLGLELRAKSVAGDDRDLIAELLLTALRRVDLVIVTGGLGPTDDDLTREAVSQALGLALAEDPVITERIAARFASRGLRMPEINRRQAMVLHGAAVLPNPHGTAPGQYLQVDGRVVLLLPGPPREMKPMLTAACDGPLADRLGREQVHRARIFIVGRSESHVDEQAQPIYSQWRAATSPIATTILAAPGQIELHLSLRSTDASGAEALARAHAQLVEALGDDVFSTDGRSMEEIVGSLLRDRTWTIAAAESCTGGLMMSRLTAVPGSSDYVRGGAVVYSNDLKERFAGVPHDLLQAHGAVSEPVAAALAEGIRGRTQASIGVGITGIAGPGGGTPEKPVGTVAIAVAGPDSTTRVRTYRFIGGRAQIRFSATQAALDVVRRLALQ